MADGITVKTNLPDFKRQLRAFGLDMERKVFRAGVAASAQVFRKRVEEVAPVRTGRLKRAIYVRRSRDSTTGREHYFVGVRQGKAARNRNVRHKGKVVGTGNLDAFYWRFVELGHLVRRRGSGVRGGRRSQALQRARLSALGARRVPARPFLAPAFQRGKDEALQAFTVRVQQRIDKENAKR